MNRRFLTTVALGLGFASLVSAQEFGVDATTSSGFTAASANVFSLGERLDAWYTLPFDLRGGGFSLKAHAEAGLPANASADIDELAATMVFAKPGVDLKSLKWTLGRFGYADVTGLILNHPLDGSALDFDFGGLDLRVTTGFTGLLLKSTSGVTLSLADQESKSILATQRFVGAIDTGWTLFETHTLSLGAVAQQDLTPKSQLLRQWSDVSSDSKGGRVSTQYLTLKGDGPLADKLFYDASFTFESGTTLSWVTDESFNSFYEYMPVTGVLANVGVTWYVPSFLSSSFNAQLTFASGDGDSSRVIEGNTEGTSTLFFPVTASGTAVVFNPGLSNLGLYQLGGSLKPLPLIPFVLSAKVLAFQRLVPGVVDAPGVLRTGPLWMGEEVDVSAAWQPVSDAQLTASVGAFLPTGGTFAPEAPAIQYAVKAGVKISL